MTLTEFRENITTWGELIDFCYQENLYDCIDDIYSFDSFEESVWNDIHDWEDSVDDLRRWLDDLPIFDADYYYMDSDWNGWVAIDPSDPVDDYRKNDVEDVATESGVFDEEDEVDQEELADAVANAVDEELAFEEPEWEIQEFNFEVLASISQPGAQILASVADMMQTVGTPAQSATTVTETVDYVEPEIAFSPAANIDSLLSGWRTVTVTASANESLF